MKNLLLSIALIFTIFLNAQNQKLISKMAECSSEDDLKLISESITFGKEFKHFKDYTTGTKIEKYQIKAYIPNSMTPEGESLNQDEKAKSILINFGQYNKGENTDLGVKGQTVYFFREASGSYVNLISFWMNTFYPNVTKEEVYENSKLREYRVNKDLKYKLTKEGDIWTISKSY
jgi:hypothetical protein